jgi:predicted amidohydrolase YtcJ
MSGKGLKERVDKVADFREEEDRPWFYTIGDESLEDAELRAFGKVLTDAERKAKNFRMIHVSIVSPIGEDERGSTDEGD